MFCSQNHCALGYVEQRGQFGGVEITYGLGLVGFHALCSAPTLDIRTEAPRPSPLAPRELVLGGVVAPATQDTRTPLG